MKGLNDVDLERNISIGILKDKVLMYLLDQAGGELKVLPDELDAFSNKTIMLESTQVGEGTPIISFKVIKQPQT